MKSIAHIFSSRLYLSLMVLATAVAAGCESAAESPPPPSATEVAPAGPFTVGTSRFDLTDPAHLRGQASPLLESTASFPEIALIHRP